MDARLGPLGLAVLLVLAGCAGGLPGDGSSTDETPPKGTQFVSVDRYENQSRHAQWPDDWTVTFANLSGGGNERSRRPSRAARASSGRTSRIPSPISTTTDRGRSGTTGRGTSCGWPSSEAVIPAIVAR